MANLLLILLCLFAVLASVVFITERYARPIDERQQSNLSRILIILVFVLLLGRLLQYFIES